MDDKAHPEQRLDLRQLIDWLIADGLIETAEIEGLKRLALLHASSRERDLHPLVWIAERHLNSSLPPHAELGLETLTQWLAQRAGLPYRRIDPLNIDVDAVTEVVPKAYAARYRILPLAVTDQEVEFATAEPYEREWEADLGHVLRRGIRRVIANPQDILRYQDEFFGLTSSLRRARKGEGMEPVAGIGNVEALVQLGRSGKLDANDSHIVSIVDWLLQYAFDQRASDIHIEPRRDNGNIRFRIDGSLHTVYEMPTPILGAVVARIKALGRMDVVDKRRPQDGRVKSKTPAGQEVELRLSTMPTAFGEKLVMRIFDPQIVVRGLAELGFSSSDARQWREMTAQTHGIILVTGPTGSGKTTTLYSTLKSLARPEINICTIEDPIEMIEPAFNQMQVNQATGVDFAVGVKTLLRQDPDIIMVGEIRDLQTAGMAVQAALTGHLVLSTLHTNDAASAVTRLLDIGVPAYLINATLLGVVAQRLARTLCPHCKQPQAVDADAWQAMVAPWSVAPPEQVMAASGCLECRKTGYLGRAGLYEILRFTPDLRKLIGSDTSLDAIRRQGYRQGTRSLRISGAAKVRQGLITIEEVMRVTPAPGEI
ncbi:MAG: type II secretion system protein E [Candidatus Sedimenticola endophacoides]|uniref:Type II secretion system protein E n=2 Tax=Candidatus Sedimenticola endophacoides TaxID=2548426 RepID=A0A6N4DWU0_9GAMM|nr:MAG: type II secretion system protein E [Candidatus Sedimenticola endophacoides]OQX37001.1 MAG: type II secretion system protein E [Candidatus Sedimenticola endophacoides]OQX44747.1 MAG: type II secretion system protein E [Candidatus Sedimenticola endophacoides]PUE00959.1 MAG: type II secretion system protein E [Candidatus Sedimenticola endophacoides]PUE01266.1 MAG: type II secretion system protein E [Candidatus Sedimenticola endophacoides]